METRARYEGGKEGNLVRSQTTLARPFVVKGIGVHTGQVCTLAAQPAPEDTGIVFQRLDLPGQPLIPATVGNVGSTLRCTRLGDDQACVYTVEHLMAALRGMEVDNCLLTMDGCEVPIMDGSAVEFANQIRAAGVREQDRARRVLRLQAPVWISDGERHVVALPSERLRISFTFTNDKQHKALSDQYVDFVITPEVFTQEIAPARTIGWLAEVEKLRAQGLIQGGSPDIAVVIGEDEILTPMRFPNELVRHKVLDTVGDLGLLGHLQAHVICLRSGHQLNVLLGQAIWRRAMAVSHVQGSD